MSACWRETRSAADANSNENESGPNRFIDAFGAFMVNPSTYKTQLANIQKAADDYWKSR